ncbi:hypothetical protein LCGC14_1402910, partial [marine sediment metagenome]
PSEGEKSVPKGETVYLGKPPMVEKLVSNVPAQNSKPSNIPKWMDDKILRPPTKKPPEHHGIIILEGEKEYIASLNDPKAFEGVNLGELKRTRKTDSKLSEPISREGLEIALEVGIAKKITKKEAKTFHESLQPHREYVQQTEEPQYVRFQYEGKWYKTKDYTIVRKEIFHWLYRHATHDEDSETLEEYTDMMKKIEEEKKDD